MPDPADHLRDALDLIREAIETYTRLPASERFETAMHEAEAVVKAVHEIGERPGRRVLRFERHPQYPREWRACTGGLLVATIRFDDAKHYEPDKPATAVGG